VNRFDHRIALSDAAVADHERLQRTWCAVLTPAIGETDARLTFAVFESVVGAVARLRLASEILFKQSLGDHPSVERLLCAKANRLCNFVARDAAVIAALRAFLPELTTGGLIATSHRLQEYAERRDATS